MWITAQMCQKILSQPNFNPKQKLVWPHNAVEPTTPHKLLRYFQETQEPYVSNGRRPKFCSRQPKKMIFGMQPYFDPTRWNTEDDLNIFSNGRWPQFFSNGRRPQFFPNGRQPYFVLVNLGSWFSEYNLILTQPTATSI